MNASFGVTGVLAVNVRAAHSPKLGATIRAHYLVGNNPTSAGNLLKASYVCCGDQVAGRTVCASLSRSLPNQPAERLIDADGEQQFAGREGGERVAEERIRGSTGCRVIGGQ